MAAPVVMQTYSIQPSRLLLGVQLVVVVLVTFAVFQAEVRLFVQASVLALMIVAVWAINRQWRTLSLRCLSDGGMEISEEGNWLSVEVEIGSVVTAAACLLHLRVNGKHRYVPVLPDSMNREAHRRLRTWLRWRAI